MATLSPEDTESLSRFALRVAEAAGHVLLPRFVQLPEVMEKRGGGKGFDPVTAADREAEAVMRRMIMEAYPEHGISGEEMEEWQADSPFRWVLDPLDGTRAFIYGLPTWMTLVALLHENRPVIGVARQPLLDESWLGTEGGAWKIDARGQHPLSTRPHRPMAEALAGTTLPEIYHDARERHVLEVMRNHTRMLRHDADAWFYVLVAAGRIDIALDTRLAPYDIAALIPIVRGAGGVVTDWDGRPDPLGGQVIAASTQELLDEALRLMRLPQDAPHKGDG